MSSVTQTPYLAMSKDDITTTSEESEYLLADRPKNLQTLAAEGISVLFKSFPYKLHTFQFIRRNPANTIDTLVKLYSDPKKALLESLQLNKVGYDVFFMVNEGTGTTPKGKRIPRCQEAVRSLSRCFIDTDNCPVAKVHAYLLEVGIPAHLIVESSKDRYHFYFFLKETPKTEESIAKWEAIQKILARLGDPLTTPKALGTDATMHDYSKVLRVPGFTHVTKRFTSKVVASRDIALYGLEELFLMTGAQAMIDQERIAPPSHVPDVTATDQPPIAAGGRFQALQALAMSLANRDDLSTPEKWETFHKFALTGVDNTDNVYISPQGTLTDKSKDLLQSALKKIKRESTQKIEILQTSLEKKDDPTPSPWELPDSFYLSAPNGFGDVVRQVMEYSKYPCASLAFGTFLAGLSILKAKTHLAPGGRSPGLYIINVAISGYGKGDPMTLMQNLLVHEGAGKLIENEVRSDRGIYEHLAANDSMGLFILDEIAPFLRAIQDKKAASHLANTAKILLSFYSNSAQRGISLGKIAKPKGKDKDKEIVLDYPTVAILGYTVPAEFQRSFTLDSVEGGMFQRFIPIVADIRRVPESPKADPHALVKSDLFKLPIQAQELDQEGNPVPTLQSIAKTRMPFTGEAFERFKALSSDYRDKQINAANDPELSHTQGIYSRIAEQVERVATTLSQDAIDLKTLEYAITFMESRHTATLATIGDTIFAGSGTEAAAKRKKIMRALVRLLRKNESPIVERRELHRSVESHVDGIKDLETRLYDLEALGRVKLACEMKNGRPYVTQIALGDVLE